MGFCSLHGPFVGPNIPSLCPLCRKADVERKTEERKAIEAQKSKMRDDSLKTQRAQLTVARCKQGSRYNWGELSSRFSVAPHVDKIRTSIGILEMLRFDGPKDSNLTVLLAHGRQMPDAWVKVPMYEYKFAYMVPCGYALNRNAFVQPMNKILDYVTFFRSHWFDFKAPWCVPQHYLGPHIPDEILGDDAMVQALCTVLEHANIAIVTALNTSKEPTKAVGDLEEIELNARIYDEKVPLLDILASDIWKRDHGFLFMTCRSPWVAVKPQVAMPKGKGEDHGGAERTEGKGPDMIHTWYSQDHIDFNNQIR